jgi:hypothetical protein
MVEVRRARVPAVAGAEGDIGYSSTHNRRRAPVSKRDLRAELREAALK